MTDDQPIGPRQPVRFSDWPAHLVFTIESGPPRPRLVIIRDAVPGTGHVLDPARPFRFDRRRWRRHGETLWLIPVGIDGAAPFNGKALRQWRLARYFSQSETARMLGTHPMTITAWEAGRQMPPAMLPLALAALDAGLAPVEPESKEQTP